MVICTVPFTGTDPTSQPMFAKTLTHTPGEEVADLKVTPGEVKVAKKVTREAGSGPLFTKV